MPADNDEYCLTSFTGVLSVEYTQGAPEKIPLHDDSKPLIFKLSDDWTGDGHAVTGFTRGHFIAFAPSQWEQKGDSPVEPEACAADDFQAYYFFRNGEHETKSVGGFEECPIMQVEDGFTLHGQRLADDSEDGELFVGAPPVLKSARQIVWARVGEERQEGWRGENFKPADKSLGEVLNGRQGRFFIRVYDKSNKRVYDKSNKTRAAYNGQFRYCANLQRILVNRKPYSPETLLLPSSEGHPPTDLQFVGANQADGNLRIEIESPHVTVKQAGRVTVAPHPKGDNFVCTLISEAGRVDIVIKLPRIWWRLKHGGEPPQKQNWRDTPLAMTREEFRAYASQDAVIQLRLPRRVTSVRAGFNGDRERNFPVKDGLPLKDFVDDEKIDEPLEEHAALEIQCEDAVRALVRVTADPPSPPPPLPCPPPGPQQQDRVFAQVHARGGGWRRGKGFSRGELQGAGLTDEDAARLRIRVDRRRRTVHDANLEALGKVRHDA